MKKIYVFLILILINKINAQSLLWANALNTFGSVSIAHDKSENCIVLGQLSSTVDLDPGAGVANLTAVGTQDIFVAKYDANGNYLWAFNIGSVGGNTYGTAIILDKNDNILVTGMFQGTCDFNPGTGTNNFTAIGQRDMFIAKYDINGNYIWAFNVGSQPATVTPHSLTVDTLENVIVTGEFDGAADFNPTTSINSLTPNGVSDIFIVKYDKNGDYLWAFNIGGYGGGSSAEGYGVAIDTIGNIFITGQFIGVADFNPGPPTTNLSAINSSGGDGFLAKYDSNGNYIWAYKIECNVDGDAYGNCLSTDNNGDIIVMGSFAGTIDFNFGSGVDTLHSYSSDFSSGANEDIFIAKYHSDGNYVWAFNLGYPDYLTGLNMTSDVNNNLLVTGYFTGTIDFNPGLGGDSLTTSTYYTNDMFLAKYDMNGNYIWAFNVGGNNLGTVGAWVTADENNNVWVTGNFNGTNVDFDPSAGTYNLNTTTNGHEMYIAKYNSLQTTSIKENDLIKQIKIYPNPVSSTLQIAGITNQDEIKVYDVLGNAVNIPLTPFKGGNAILDVSILPSGVYFVRIGASTQKFIKQ